MYMCLVEKPDENACPANKTISIKRLSHIWKTRDLLWESIKFTDKHENLY